MKTKFLNLGVVASLLLLVCASNASAGVFGSAFQKIENARVENFKGGICRLHSWGSTLI